MEMRAWRGDKARVVATPATLGGCQLLALRPLIANLAGISVKLWAMRPLRRSCVMGAGPRAQIASDGISVVMTIDAQYDGFYGYFMRIWMDLAMPTGRFGLVREIPIIPVCAISRNET